MIDLTLYPTEEIFAIFHPGESYSVHQIQRATVVAWCKERGIRIVDHKITKKSATTAKTRAKEAADAHPFYRLGLKIAQPTARSEGAIGWWMYGLETKDHGGKK